MLNKALTLKAAVFVCLVVVAGTATYTITTSKAAQRILNAGADGAEAVSDAVNNASEGVGATTPDAKKQTKEVLEPCTSNAECKNGACGREHAGTGALSCCASGSVVTHSLKDFCTQIPDGNPCLSDVMCQSGYCRGDRGGFRTGVCQPMAKQGEQCEVDADCGNKACARATAKPGALLSCCASGRTQMYAGFHYCSEMADGSACWSDAMCKSGYCSGNGGGTRRGTCQTKAKAGQACRVNLDCDSHACARATARKGARLSCCASGATKRYAGYDYCAQMRKGATCWSDAMCKSGTCKGNAGGLKRGTCR